MAADPVPIYGERPLLRYNHDDRERRIPSSSEQRASKRRFKALERERYTLTHGIRVLRELRPDSNISIVVVVCLRTNSVTEKVLESLEVWAKGPIVTLVMPDVREFPKYTEEPVEGSLVISGECLTYEAPGIGQYHRVQLDFSPEDLLHFRLGARDTHFREPADVPWTLQEIALRLEIVILKMILAHLGQV